MVHLAFVFAEFGHTQKNLAISWEPQGRNVWYSQTLPT